MVEDWKPEVYFPLLSFSFPICFLAPIVYPMYYKETYLEHMIIHNGGVLLMVLYSAGCAYSFRKQWIWFLRE